MSSAAESSAADTMSDNGDARDNREARAPVLNRAKPRRPVWTIDRVSVDQITMCTPYASAKASDMMRANLRFEPNVMPGERITPKLLLWIRDVSLPWGWQKPNPKYANTAQPQHTLTIALPEGSLEQRFFYALDRHVLAESKRRKKEIYPLDEPPKKDGWFDMLVKGDGGKMVPRYKSFYKAGGSGVNKEGRQTSWGPSLIVRLPVTSGRATISIRSAENKVLPMTAIEKNSRADMLVELQDAWWDPGKFGTYAVAACIKNLCVQPAHDPDEARNYADLQFPDDVPNGTVNGEPVSEANIPASCGSIVVPPAAGQSASSSCSSGSSGGGGGAARAPDEPAHSGSRGGLLLIDRGDDDAAPPSKRAAKDRGSGDAAMDEVPTDEDRTG